MPSFNLHNMIHSLSRYLTLPWQLQIEINGKCLVFCPVMSHFMGMEGNVRYPLNSILILKGFDGPPVLADGYSTYGIIFSIKFDDA